jgi:pyruvate dehydrogenase E2 component (dihydrolipoyllysine-residue acetyltransferase)
MGDRYEKLDGAELCFHDGQSLSEPPGFLLAEEVDMQATQEVVAQLRQHNIKGTYTHVIVRAVALALTRHPEFNRLLRRKQLVYPDTIDIGLSVSGQAMAAALTLVVQDTGHKDLVPLAQEIIKRVPEVRAEEAKTVHMLRQIARWLPAAWMRRCLLRLMLSRVSVVKEMTGTFYVTCFPQVSFGATFKFMTSSALSFSRVEDRVVVRDGQPIVRPMTTFGLTLDHRLWTGSSASALLKELKKILESGELAAEIPLVESSATRQILLR